MVSIAAIRRVEVQGSSKGLDTLERNLKAVSNAQEAVARSSETVTRTSERQERRQLSLAGSFENLMKRLDATYRAQSEYERAQRLIDRSFQQAAINSQQYDRAMSLLASRYDAAGIAADRAAARVHELKLRFDEGYAAVSRMDQELADLAEAERAGVRITGGYANAIDALVLKHDKAAQAAQRQAQELKALAEAERLVASQADGQSRWNTYAGVNRASAGSARDSAAVFEAASREADDMARSVAALRAQIDPAGAAQSRLNAELMQYQALADQGAIDARELAAAQDLARKRYDETAASLRKLSSANDNARHGGAFNASNLAAQGFDIASTAAFMPASTVAIQQGPQVAQIFNDIRSSGAKIGPTVAAAFMQVLSPITLATVGVIGLTAATVQWLASARDVRTLDDVLQDHAKTVEHLTILYGNAAKAVEDVATSGGKAFSRAMVGIDMTDLKKQLDTQMGELRKSLRGDGGISEGIASLFGMGSNGGEAYIKNLERLGDGMSVYQGAADKFLASIRAGAPDLGGFSKNLDAIYQSQVNLGGNANDLMNAADALKVIGAAAVDVKSEFSKFSAPIAQAVVAISDGNFRMGDFIKRIDEIGAANGMVEQANKVIGLFRNVVEVTDAINQLKNAELAAQRNFEGRGIQGLDYEAAGQERRRINELRDAEKERTDARIQGLRAVTDQEKIAAAAASAGAGITNSTERRIREENAALEERARIEEEISQGARDRDLQRQSDLSRQQQELDLIGKSVGEIARLQYQFEQMEAIKQEAARAGRIVTPEEIAAIDAAAAAIGKMTEQMALANAQRDLLFERQQMTRNPVEQRVASALRNVYGDDYQSQMNGALAGQIRLNEQWKKAQDELRSIGDIGADALGGLLDILYESGDATEKLISLFAGIGKQFAQMGLDRIMENLKAGKSAFDLSSMAKPSAAAPLPSVAANVGVGAGAGVGAIKTAAVISGKEMGAAVAPVIRSSLAASYGSGGSMADILHSAADRLGTSARDLATVISYETGGTFSTGARNSSGHIGLIQFGKAEQQKYGVAIGQTFAKQMDAVVAFLQDRGFKPGMGMLDLYSTINAGRPGRYNAVDGTTTVRQKVETQFAGHYANADKLLQKEAVRDGVVAGIDKSAQTASVSAQVPSTTAATPGSVNSANKLQSLLDVGGAAFGAFAGGYQSGSPLMGGISGAMSGFGAAGAIGSAFPALAGVAGPIGLIGGAILGVVGGILGKKKQQRQERKAAQQQLNQNKSALEELFARGEGRGLGATTQAYNDFYDKTAQLDEIAQKAGDDELVKKLRDNVNKFFIILEKDFIGKFPGLIQAYSSGLGSNSPFVQGAAEMEQLREEVKNFVADARSFGELQLKNKRDLTPEQLEARVAEAERAAQKMVLANISGVRELGRVEAGLLRLDGVAVAAKTSLEQLGMEAEEAAKAVQGQLNVAIAKLKDNLLRDLTSSLNDLSGVGFLNDIMDAQVLYQQRLDDASRLGIDGSLALRELSLSIQEIVKQAGLGKDELAMLAQSFPQLQFILNSVSTSSMTLADATSELQAAYDKEASALDDLIAASKNGIAAIKQFRDAMKINDSSPLSPADKVAEAAKQFRELATKAAGGDTEALGQLTQIGQDYLDEARSYYASSAGYLDIWNEVDSTLARVKTATEGQLSKAEQQKRSLDASVSGILDINTSVKSVAEALAQYNATQATGFQNLATQLGLMAKIGSSSIDAAYQANIGRAPEAAGKAYWQNQLNSGKTVDQVVDAIANSREAQIAGVYREIMKRDIDSASRSYWMQSGKSIEQIRADLTYAKTQGAMRLGGVVGAYATGGVVGNGIYDVDSVRARYAGGGDILLAGGEFVTRAGSNNGATRPTLDYINRTGNLPGNDNSALIAAINRLTAENAEIKTAMRMLAAATAEGSEKQAKATARMAASVGEMTDELKRENSR